MRAKADWATRRSLPGCKVTRSRLRVASLDPVQLREVARLWPELIPIRANRAAADPSLEPWQRIPFFDALAHAFQEAAPLVLVADDLQWSDADSLEWLHYFLRTDAPLRCLVVATLRAGERPGEPRPRRARERDGAARAADPHHAGTPRRDRNGTARRRRRRPGVRPGGTKPLCSSRPKATRCSSSSREGASRPARAAAYGLLASRPSWRRGSPTCPRTRGRWRRSLPPSAGTSRSTCSPMSATSRNPRSSALSTSCGATRWSASRPASDGLQPRPHPGSGLRGAGAGAPAADSSPHRPGARAVVRARSRRA